MNEQRRNARMHYAEGYAAAQAVARGLYARLADAVHARQIQEGFGRLAGLIEALPLGVERGRIGFLRNWVASAQVLWTQGEIGACRYQVGQIGRLLQRLRKEAE